MPVNHLFFRMAYTAATTSLAIRLINSWTLNLQAFALTRVRLEQFIICSYIIHEDESIGLDKFAQYMPIQRYKGMKVAMENNSLREHLKNFRDLDELKEDAIKAQQEFMPGFSCENDKFERSWTKLSLRSLAKKRDSLVPADPLMKHPLEREYLSVYKVACSIIHADCDSLSYNFIDFFQSPSGKPVLMPLPSLAFNVAACTAHYDIVQCYEVLNRVGIPPAREYHDLMKQWFNVRDKFKNKKA